MLARYESSTTRMQLLAPPMAARRTQLTAATHWRHPVRSTDAHVAKRERRIAAATSRRNTLRWPRRIASDHARMIWLGAGQALAERWRTRTRLWRAERTETRRTSHYREFRAKVSLLGPPGATALQKGFRAKLIALFSF